MNDSAAVEVRDRPRQAAPRRTGFNVVGLWALYLLTLRQHLHGKRWIVLTALFLTPALLAGLVRATASDAQGILLEFLLIFMFIPQALLPLVALLYGSGIIQDEQEEQTLTYLLMRPMSKWGVYQVKLLATLTTTVALTAVFTTLTYLVIYVGGNTAGENIPLRCLKAIGVHALAVVAYCCLFSVMSLFTRWTLILGFIYAGLVEGLVANLPFFIRMGTIIYHARVIAYRSMEFTLIEPRGRKVDMAADAWQMDLRPDGSLAEPSLGACLAALLVASLALTALGALVCSWREFHVKTPEGS
jgi:ABC-2 type transport system permease protein